MLESTPRPGLRPEEVAPSGQSSLFVIPAKAGIQYFKMVPRLRGDDVWIPVYTGMTNKR
jgi:hypothetical protein